MEKAIKRAIEGGYFVENIMLGGKVMYENQFSSRGLRHTSDLFLDPLFWQALGKAEGWKSLDIFKAKTDGKPPMQLEEWQMYWHSFIDALIEEKSPDEFFNNLLK